VQVKYKYINNKYVLPINIFFYFVIINIMIKIVKRQKIETCQQTYDFVYIYCKLNII